MVMAFPFVPLLPSKFEIHFIFNLLFFVLLLIPFKEECSFHKNCEAAVIDSATTHYHPFVPQLSLILHLPFLLFSFFFGHHGRNPEGSCIQDNM